MPERIQLRRTKGWRKPEGTIVVSRPSKWGNPFRVGPAASARGGPLDMWAVTHDGRTLGRYDDPHDAARDAVDRYRLRIAEQDMAAAIRRDLAGKDLACWCWPGDPCHADVLLAIAAGQDARS